MNITTSIGTRSGKGAKTVKISETITNGFTGTFETEDLSEAFDSGIFVVAFYDNAGNNVTPTGGTIKPEMSPIAGQWHEPSSGDVTINATDVKAGVATYNIPVFLARAEKGRVILTGITGSATRVEAYFWRSV